MADQTTVAETGNVLVAQAMRQCKPDVMAAYPITPQTTIVEEFAKYVAQGRCHTEYVTVESEHSAMSACVGASAAGARVMTATCSQGLALMWEELHIASGMRLPIVMANANRALSAPINIHCDHSDAMGARDTGWVMLFAETAQEAYDNTIMSVRIAEHSDVLLPVMTCLDGFITTHSIDRADIFDDDTVAEFVGDYVPAYALLDTDNPSSHGNFSGLGGPYFEFKKQQRLAIDASMAVIKSVGAEFSEISGRPFDVVEGWGMEDAEVAIIVIGSSAGNVRHVARGLREQGIKAGVLKIRVFRPFPVAEVRAALAGVKAIAVLDRSESFGAEGGPLYLEVRSALYDSSERVPVVDYIYGLGGSDVRLELIERVYSDLADIASGSMAPFGMTYLGTR
ncbi:MAG: pyruvate ferredoxin oxidoreductase [Actinomycetota bacterium]|nr:pyruvate ferredoxin oxidoreductase [Actinomycetota bacterium]